jgi:hypothetical protein
VSSPLSVVTGTWRSSVPHNWCNFILAAFFSKDQTDNNRMVLGQDCRVGMATLYIQNMWVVSVVCTHMYGLVLYGGETLETFFIWDKLDRGRHLDFLLFQCSGWRSCPSGWRSCPSGQDIPKCNHFYVFHNILLILFRLL